MATDSVTITHDQFAQITKPLIGMVLRETRFGFVNTLLGEIGRIRSHVDRDRLERRGEASLMIEPGWRIEARGRILVGSDSENIRLARMVKSLGSMRLARIELEGKLPELVLGFDSGWILRSFRCIETPQMWCLFLNDEALFPKPRPTSKNFKVWLTAEGRKLKLEWAHGRNPYTLTD
jgi:hypothetical protein